MDYKQKKIEGNKEEYFVYRPNLSKRKKNPGKNKSFKESPFDKLAELRFR